MYRNGGRHNGQWGNDPIAFGNWIDDRDAPLWLKMQDDFDLVDMHLQNALNGDDSGLRRMYREMFGKDPDMGESEDG